MCGLAASIDFQGAPDRHLTKKMIEIIRHRGPDDEQYLNLDRVSLGFCRLTIVDSRGGRQPMSTATGRFHIIFNGEIYNAPELRNDLEAQGERFVSSNSDTEVILIGFQKYGNAFFEKLNGMFAVIIWDQEKQQAVVARDRFGIKPLYFVKKSPSSLFFCSEIKGLVRSGIVAPAISKSSILKYFSFQDTWAPDCPFEEVKSVSPGEILIIKNGSISSKTFWKLCFNREPRSDAGSLVEHHEDLLRKSIRRSMIADTDVGAYLSGGIDSSAISALAQEIHPKIKTFSCVFDLEGVKEDDIRDERFYSRLMADKFSFDHSEYSLSPENYLDLNLEVARALDYPHMGPSYENLFMAKSVNSSGIKVIMSGLGGDEFHGGYYYRYDFLRDLRAKSKSKISLLNFLRGHRGNDRRDIIKTITQMMNFPVPDHDRSDVFDSDFLACTQLPDSTDQIDQLTKECPSDDLWDIMMYLDFKTYLAGLLTLEDNLSMHYSLEARVPLLDNELVDFCLRVPWDQMIDNRTGKNIFRKSMLQILPEKIVWKEKMGFAPPEMSWYRGKLKEFVCDHVLSSTFALRGVLQRPKLEEILETHFDGSANHQNLIWSLISYSLWMDENQISILETQ